MHEPVGAALLDLGPMILRRGLLERGELPGAVPAGLRRPGHHSELNAERAVEALCLSIMLCASLA